jgi:hypothetical protein
MLLVDSEEKGSTCRFSGDQTSACGQCIAAHCQAAVNACCADSACAAHLDTLDECGSGASCNGLVLAPLLGSCISSSCTVCQIPEGGLPDAPVNSLRSQCIGDNDGCLCFGAPTPNTIRCDTTTVTAALCCADANYPAKNNSCSCEVFNCGASPGGGSCSTSPYDRGTHSWSGDGCCASPSLCSCDDVQRHGRNEGAGMQGRVRPLPYGQAAGRFVLVLS